MDLNNDTVVSLINAINGEQGVLLPLTSEYPNRILTFKDISGNFSSNNFVINTQSNDTFDNGFKMKVLCNNYESITLYSDPLTSKWTTLNNSADWSYFGAKTTVNFNNQITSNILASIYSDIDIYANPTGFKNGLVSYLGRFCVFNSNLGPTSISYDWASNRAVSNVDLSGYEISNVNQTNNSNSGATNIIARRIYFDLSGEFNIDNLTFSNILNTAPPKNIYFMNPNGFFTYLNCTVSFRCNNVRDDLAYFLTLSNVSLSNDLSGMIFNHLFPYIENQKSLFDYNHSITFQEQFDISSWSDGQEYLPMLFVIANTGSHRISNYYFSMTYEPLISS